MIKNNRIYTVDEMSCEIRKLICSDSTLQNISVRGELSGIKKHTSGHVYFNILGKESRVAAVLFKSNAYSVLSWPQDGDEVLVTGRVDVYSARGLYQVYANNILPLGAGAKARAKEMLKAKLEKEGLFSPYIKRPLPAVPMKVAVITSPTGAALQDVLKISLKRYPLTELLVVPSLMQGEGAYFEILKSFKKIALRNDIDVIMLVRGGGAREDLDIFDNEDIVRAIRSSKVPVITGLGHQIDSTLSDMVADAYSPTPSGAAEYVFPDKNEINKKLYLTCQLLSVKIKSVIDRYSDSLDSIKKSQAFTVKRVYIDPIEKALDYKFTTFKSVLYNNINIYKNKIAYFASVLNNLSPLKIIASGYLIAETSDRKRISSIKDAVVGSDIVLTLSDGVIGAEVKDIKE